MRPPGGLQALFGRWWHMWGGGKVTPTTGRCDCMAARLVLLATLFAGFQGGCGRGQFLDAPSVPAPPMPPAPSAEIAAPAVNAPVSFMAPPYRAGGGVAPAAIPTPIPITFAAALSLVARQNPQVAFANEQVNEAFAQLQGAQVLWLPAIRAGVGYINHDGPVQNSDGTITTASRTALEGGLGMYAVGGGVRRFPASPPSSASRTRFSSRASPIRRWRHGSTPSRPPPTTCFSSWRWRISISCGPSSSRRLRKRPSSTPDGLPS